MCIRDRDKAVLESILSNQSDLTELYTEPTYDELKEVLANYLNPSDESETTTTTATPAATTQTTTSTPTEKKTENVEDAFDQLFNS